jgi:hypothetical protein
VTLRGALADLVVGVQDHAVREHRQRHRLHRRRLDERLAVEQSALQARIAEGAARADPRAQARVLARAAAMCDVSVHRVADVDTAVAFTMADSSAALSAGRRRPPDTSACAWLFRISTSAAASG